MQILGLCQTHPSTACSNLSLPHFDWQQDSNQGVRHLTEFFLFPLLQDLQMVPAVGKSHRQSPVWGASSGLNRSHLGNRTLLGPKGLQFQDCWKSRKQIQKCALKCILASVSWCWKASREERKLIHFFCIPTSSLCSVLCALAVGFSLKQVGR